MVNSTQTLDTGKEHKLAVTFNAATKVTTIYIDGVEDASGTANQSEAYMLALVAADTRNYIGRTQWWDSNYSADNVDFDGTIVTHEYPNIGKPIPFAIETLKKLQQEGHHQLILWTCREGELLQEAIDYCASKGLEFYSVNSNFPEENADIVRARKLEAELFIDDRNLGGIPYWGVIYQMVMSGNCHRPVCGCGDPTGVFRKTQSKLAAAGKIPL